MRKVSGIYLITCKPEGKLPYYYVGQSVNVALRFRDHKGSLRRGNHHNQIMQYLFNKYGVDSFSFEILEEVDRDLLDEVEAWWLKEMVGYNRVCNFSKSPTAPMRGLKFSDDHRRKLGTSKLGDKHWTRRLGVSQESRQKQSQFRRGRSLSEEVKKNMSLAQFKRHVEKPPKRGSESKLAKPVIGTNEKTGETIRFACMLDAKTVGFSPEKISLCCNGHRPRHLGFTWKFDDVR